VSDCAGSRREQCVVRQRREPKIPSPKSWLDVHNDLESKAKQFSKQLATEFKIKFKIYSEDHNQIINKSLPGVAEREKWIDELWTVDCEQSQYQIVALLVAE
jgi:hypothetical protein